MTSGAATRDLAINQATNQIYAEMKSEESLSVIDGATNNTATIALPDYASGTAINPVTDKMYVAGLTSGIYVVDGSPNTITTEITGIVESRIMVNPVTNKIYAFGSDPDNFNTLLAAIDGATNNIYPVHGISASSPAFVQVDPVRNKIYAWGNNEVYVVDGATNGVSNIITDGTFSMTSFSGPPVLNPVNGNVYKDFLFFGLADVASLQPTVPNPLVATINPLTGNATSNPSPSLTFTTSSSFAPIAPPVQNVYYQLDTTQSTWLPATGTAPSFSATLSSVPLGSHVLFYYATDGSDSTSLAAGSTSIGAVSAYPFTVVNP